MRPSGVVSYVLPREAASVNERDGTNCGANRDLVSNVHLVNGDGAAGRTGGSAQQRSE